MKKLIYCVIFFLILTFTFFNLGKWLDVTEKPVKSDIVVCLGGGTIDRVKKSIELVKQGYTNEEHFLLVGESWYNQPYLKKHYPKMNIVIDESPRNTGEEVRLIKKYMKEHGHKSALIVTDPPHSRRVSILASLISMEDDETMHFRMVGSDVKWWNKEHYYHNNQAIGFVKNECLGIFYTLIVYGFFERIGLLDVFETWRQGREN